MLISNKLQLQNKEMQGVSKISALKELYIIFKNVYVIQKLSFEYCQNTLVDDNQGVF